MQNYFFDDEDVTIRVEVSALSLAASDEDGSLQDASRLGDKAKAVAQQSVEFVRDASDEAVKNAFRTIYKMAQNTGRLINSLQSNPQGVDQSSLAKVEVEFGLKFNGNVETFINFGGESNINVKLTWETKAPEGE